MRGKPYLVKIIRDRIADHVPNSTVTYEPIQDHSIAIEALRKKLCEEAIEYALKPGIEELADCQETIHALTVHDFPQGPARNKLALQRAVKKKREERGGFDKLIGLFITADEP